MKFLSNSQFVKDASVLTVGTSVAQFLPMLIYPVLSRLYTPEQFAALAAFTSLITILQVLGSCKYETAILISETDISAANIFSLSLSLSIILALLLYSIFAIFGVSFTYDYTSGMCDLIWLVPITVVLLNIFTCYNEWCVRRKYFKKLSLNKISNSAFVSLSKYLLSFTRMQTVGLTVGDFVGRLITAITCLLRIYIHDSAIFKKVSLAGIVSEGKANIKFPIYTMPAQLFNSVAVASPVFILNYYYTEEIVGFYSMTMSVLLLPINVISYAVRDVFRKKANDIYKEYGHFDGLYKKIFILFFLLTIVASLFVAPFLPELFSFVLGDKWTESGRYSQILLPMIGLDFIAMSLSGVFIVTQRLKELFWWQLFYCTVSIITLFFPSYLQCSIDTTLMSFGTGRIIAYITLIYSSYKYSKGQ